MLDEVGAIFYQEFGSGFDEYKYYYGALAGFNLPWDIRLNTEVIGQYSELYTTAAYFIEATRVFTWENGSNSALSAKFIGQIEIDEDALFYPAFSNMFLGEVLRADSKDIPLVYSSIKHIFPWETGFYVRLRYTQRVDENELREIGFETGIKLFHHLKITGMVSAVSSEELTEDIMMTRLELRLAF